MRQCSISVDFGNDGYNTTGDILTVLRTILKESATGNVSIRVLK